MSVIFCVLVVIQVSSALGVYTRVCTFISVIVVTTPLSVFTCVYFAHSYQFGYTFMYNVRVQILLVKLGWCVFCTVLYTCCFF